MRNGLGHYSFIPELERIEVLLRTTPVEKVDKYIANNPEKAVSTMFDVEETVIESSQITPSVLTDAEALANTPKASKKITVTDVENGKKILTRLEVIRIQITSLKARVALLKGTVIGVLIFTVPVTLAYFFGGKFPYFWIIFTFNMLLISFQLINIVNDFSESKLNSKIAQK